MRDAASPLYLQNASGAALAPPLPPSPCPPLHKLAHPTTWRSVVVVFAPPTSPAGRLPVGRRVSPPGPELSPPLALALATGSSSGSPSVSSPSSGRRRAPSVELALLVLSLLSPLALTSLAFPLRCPAVPGLQSRQSLAPPSEPPRALPREREPSRENSSAPGAPSSLPSPAPLFLPPSTTTTTLLAPLASSTPPRPARA